MSSTFTPKTARRGRTTARRRGGGKSPAPPRRSTEQGGPSRHALMACSAALYPVAILIAQVTTWITAVEGDGHQGVIDDGTGQASVWTHRLWRGWHRSRYWPEISRLRRDSVRCWVSDAAFWGS